MRAIFLGLILCVLVAGAALAAPATTNTVAATNAAPSQVSSADPLSAANVVSAWALSQLGVSSDTLASVVVLVLGLGIVWILRAVSKAWLLRAGKRWKDPTLASQVLRALRGPLSLLVLLYFGLWAFDQFKWMPSTLWARVHSDLYPAVNGIVLVLLGFRLVDILMHVLRRRLANGRTHLDEYWAVVLGWIGKGILLLIGGMMVLQQLGVNILPLLTGASFLGAAVALASQKTISNAIGSLEILFDKLFRVGDRIAFDQYDGFVIHMGLRSVRLQALTGEIFTLPNKEIADRQIRNLSQEITGPDGRLHKAVRTTLTLTLPYMLTPAEVEQAIGEIKSTIAQHPQVLQTMAGVQRLGSMGLEVEAILWADYKTIDEYRKLLYELNAAIQRSLAQGGQQVMLPGGAFAAKVGAPKEA